MSTRHWAEFSDLVGKTLVSVEKDAGHDDALIFTCDDGTRYWMGHRQDCCETVMIEDQIGDFADILGQPILHATESSSEVEDYSGGDIEWTFYTLGNHGGWIHLRWCGESNGYYSTDVNFYLLDPVKELR